MISNETTQLIPKDVEAASDAAKPQVQHDIVPSWSELMATIKPFVRPQGWKHSLYAIVALLTVLIGKLLSVLPPLAIKYAVDKISEINSMSAPDATETSQTLNAVIHAVLAFFGLKAIIMLNGIVEDLAQRTVALDAERRFATKLFSHLHTLSLSYHLEKHIGEITRIMNRGSDSISTVISSFLFYILPTFFQAIIVSVVFWKLVEMPMIAVSTLVAIVLYLGFTIFVTKTRIIFRRKLIEASDAVGQKETETLVNYETVSMFGRTRYEIEQYSKLRQEYKDRRVEMLAMFALLQAGQNFIKLLGTSSGLLIAGIAAVSGEKMTAGTFVIVQMYIDQLFQPLTQLGWQYRMITQSFTDLEKAATMLNRVPEVQDAHDAVDWSASGTGSEVVFKNVSFHYKVASQKRPLGTSLNAPVSKGAGRHGMRRGRLAMGFVDEGHDKRKKSEEDEEEIIQLGGVDNIDLAIPAGNTVALVGASGSGKTTLIRLLLRMYDCDVGSISIDGMDVKRMKQQSLREQVGVVAQDTILFNATLRENIIYGKENASEDEIQEAVRLSALESFVSGLPDGLETVVGERGMKLSGGERGRVGLARCIIKNPQIILLDEATSALDSKTEKEIQRNIASICLGRTTILIAHRLSTARNADQIIVLNEGCIAEIGSHGDLLDRDGIYAEMWKLQTDTNDETNEETMK